jgi:hypothetical protein
MLTIRIRKGKGKGKGKRVGKSLFSDRQQHPNP